MTYHEWGDDDVDWEAINAATDYLPMYMRRWGRIFSHGKEKYGTVRVSAVLGHISLHGILWPAYYYNQFLYKWMWKLDIVCVTPILRFLFSRVWGKYQVFIYRKAYKNALYKWPHIEDEILEDADWPELLKGI